jgi:hypothetical protein
VKLGTKLEYAKRHVVSLLRHDDEPLAARQEAAKRLKQFIDAELGAATERESKAVKRALTAE